MSDDAHALLRRQARRVGLEELMDAPTAGQWATLIRRISATYEAADRDRYLLERSLELSSAEMRDLHADLAAEQRLLATVLGALSSGVVRLDSEWNIRFANAAARQLLVHHSEGPTALFDVLRLEANDRPVEPSKIVDILESGEVRHLHEVVVVRKDGTRFWAALSFNPLDDAGEKSVVLSIRDISERKMAQQEADEARVEAAAAERAREGQAVFLANMSHELRTPLNAILGYGELVTELAEERGYDDVVDDLKKVQVAGRHLLALINDILDVSRIEAGRIDLEVGQVDVAQLLGEIRDTLKPLALRNNNTIEVQAEGVGDIESDRVRLTQALINVAGNANKFTDGGFVRIAAEGDEDFVVITVSDDGEGMTEEVLSKVFEPFVQADSSTTRRHGGTGLGLTITRSLCEALGIWMSVESTAEEGTTFTFRIPRNFWSQNSTDRALGEPSSSGGGSVALLIDDDLATQELIRRTLVDVGVDVISAITGQQGLELARKHRPDTILLEISLPDIDGWELLSMLKSDPDTASIPLVVVSIEDGASRAFSLGAQDYLVKPIDRSRLKSILRQYTVANRPSNVLIVEDDDDLRTLLRKRIEREAPNWVVQEAANGLEACRVLEEGLPDLVLLDLMMPEMDGFEFLQRVRNKPDWRDLAVVVVTAMSLTASQRRSLDAQVARVVEKGTQTPAEIACSVLNSLGLRREEVEEP